MTKQMFALMAFPNMLMLNQGISWFKDSIFEYRSRHNPLWIQVLILISFCLPVLRIWLDYDLLVYNILAREYGFLVTLAVSGIMISAEPSADLKLAEGSGSQLGMLSAWVFPAIRILQDSVRLHRLQGLAYIFKRGGFFPSTTSGSYLRFIPWMAFQLLPHLQ